MNFSSAPQLLSAQTSPAATAGGSPEAARLPTHLPERPPAPRLSLSELSNLSRRRARQPLSPAAQGSPTRPGLASYPAPFPFTFYSQTRQNSNWTPPPPLTSDARRLGAALIGYVSALAEKTWGEGAIPSLRRAF